MSGIAVCQTGAVILSFAYCATARDLHPLHCVYCRLYSLYIHTYCATARDLCALHWTPCVLYIVHCTNIDTNTQTYKQLYSHILCHRQRLMCTALNTVFSVQSVHNTQIHKHTNNCIHTYCATARDLRALHRVYCILYIVQGQAVHNTQTIVFTHIGQPAESSI